MKKIVQYFKNVRSELAKVSWPTRGEVVNATVLVVVLSIAISIFVYACDRVLLYILNLVLQVH